MEPENSKTKNKISNGSNNQQAGRDIFNGAGPLEKSIADALTLSLAPALAGAAKDIDQTIATQIEKVIREEFFDDFRKVAQKENLKGHIKAVNEKIKAEQHSTDIIDTPAQTKAQSIDRAETFFEWMKNAENVSPDEEIAKIWQGWLYEWKDSSQTFESKIQLDVLKNLSSYEAHTLVNLYSQYKSHNKYVIDSLINKHLIEKNQFGKKILFSTTLFTLFAASIFIIFPHTLQSRITNDLQLMNSLDPSLTLLLLFVFFGFYLSISYYLFRNARFIYVYSDFGWQITLLYAKMTSEKIKRGPRASLISPFRVFVKMVGGIKGPKK